MEGHRVRFIGDVHGKFDQYLEVISGCNASIQVGDFGLGFKPPPVIIGQTGLYPTIRHKHIRGNHDDPAACAASPCWIPDGTFMGGTTMMLIGGALSIDQTKRIDGSSWWHDEECGIGAFNHFIEQYDMHRPEIMVTHDCPELVTYNLFGKDGKRDYPSRTRQAFDAMLEIHQPRLWIFGHWHRSRNEMIGNTRFICLAELEHKDIEL